MITTRHYIVWQPPSPPVQRGGWRWLARVVEWFLLWHRTLVLEIFLASEALVCGVWIMWPWHRTFGRATVLSGYPETLTGGILLLHGAVWLWALLVEVLRPSRTKGNLMLCRNAAMAGALLWLGVVGSYALRPPQTLLVVPFLSVVVFAHLWVWLRLFWRFS